MGVPLSPPVDHLWEFVLGMGLAHLIKAGTRFPLRAWMVYPMLAGVVLYFWVLNVYLHDRTSFFISGLRALTPVILSLSYAFMIGVCATADINKQPSPLRNKVLVKAGEWSYAFYLIHATILYAIREHTGKIPWSGARSILIWVGVFLASVIAAGALHLMVEKPLEKRLRRWGDARFSTAS